MKLKTNHFILFTLIFIISCFNPALENGAPGQLRLMIKNDPATTAVIGWNYFKGKKEHNVLYYDSVDHGLDVEAYAYKVSPQFYSDHKRIQSAFVELRRLVPKTKYYFVVANSFGVSKRYWFETLSDSPADRISLVAGGDSRNNREPRIKANLLVSKLRPHAVLFGGDMTSRGTAKQWWKWLDDWQMSISEDGRMTGLIAARGNHEKDNSILEKLFWTTKEVYYGVTFGGGLLRTYTLNTESSIGGNQAAWLEQDLEKNGHIEWKISQYHRPIRPHTKKKKDGSNQYKYWAPLFAEYGVDLAIESDSHTVKSTWPIVPSTRSDSDEGFVRDDRRGTVYVGEGSWGAPLRKGNDPKRWTRAVGEFNQFKWIFIDQNKLELRTVKIDNAFAVSQVDPENIFTAPENLELWKPESGEVITIHAAR